MFESTELEITRIEWNDTHNNWIARTACGKVYQILRGSIFTTPYQVARKLHSIRSIMLHTKEHSRLCFDYPVICEYDTVIRSYGNAVQFFCSVIRIA